MPHYKSVAGKIVDHSKWLSDQKIKQDSEKSVEKKVVKTKSKSIHKKVSKKKPGPKPNKNQGE